MAIYFSQLNFFFLFLSLLLLLLSNHFILMTTATSLPTSTTTTTTTTTLLPQVICSSCHDLQKPDGPLQTGIGFLDHMLDQINSHAQMGIQIVLSGNVQDKNRHATTTLDPILFLSWMGTIVGNLIRPCLPTNNNNNNDDDDNPQNQPTMISFSCPLDEALVECQLSPRTSTTTSDQCRYEHFVPLGKYPLQTGRTHLGQLNVSVLDTFWLALGTAAQLNIVLIKKRGDNAHHIIESSFKAFSRALRNYIDQNKRHQVEQQQLVEQQDELFDWLYGRNSPNALASIALQRQATIQRNTKETNIQVALQLNGGTGTTVSQISTGISTLDKFWRQVAQAAQITLQINAVGDLWIDEHHTAEDVAIAIGQCFDQALGTKAGLNRMWSCRYGTIQVTMDLSNRPCFIHNIHWGDHCEYVGDGLSCEMMEHVLESWIINARWTVHIEHLISKEKDIQTVNPIQVMEELAYALGTAIRYCTSVDIRRAGATASSKGTLSV